MKDAQNEICDFFQIHLIMFLCCEVPEDAHELWAAKLWNNITKLFLLYFSREFIITKAFLTNKK